MEKHALIIAAGAYQQADRLTPLQKTTADAEGVARVLMRRELAAFDSVNTLIDRHFSEVNREVLRFFRQRNNDDLLVLYFCGHGVRNEDGQLFLALVDTELDTLEASALDCSNLRRYMNRSRSKRQLLILDCCHSGAFDSTREVGLVLPQTKEQLAPEDQSFDPSQQQGRFVLTATEKTSLAFERDEGAPESEFSLFTQALIEGLSRESAHDAQGNITVKGLHRYVQKRVLDSSDGKQKPQIISYVGDGDLLLVKSQLRPLPEGLHQTLEHADPDKRLSGIARLKLVCDDDRSFLPTAHKALKALTRDRDNYVLRAAKDLLQHLQRSENPENYENGQQRVESKSPSGQEAKANQSSLDLSPYWQQLFGNQSLERLKALQHELKHLQQAQPQLYEIQQLLDKTEASIEDIYRQQPAALPREGMKAGRPKASSHSFKPWASGLAAACVLLFAVLIYLPMQTSKNAKPSPTPIESNGPRSPDDKGSETPIVHSPLRRPGDVFQDKLNSAGLGPKMVVIPAGKFLMGSPEEELGRNSDEGPQHRVQIQGFAMGQTEVTLAEFEQFIKSSNYVTTAQQQDDSTGVLKGCHFWKEGGGELDSTKNWVQPGFTQSKAHPVTCISWHDAKAYVKWLTKQTGHAYRLPSEAEWEYAARGGTTSPFNTGKCISGEQANFGGWHNDVYGDCPLHGNPVKQTTAVASYAANNFGLYDMHGNVWEWVEDCYHPNFIGVPEDGAAWLGSQDRNCAERVVRGGSWFDYPRRLRSAFRKRGEPNGRVSVLGFRLARTLR